jgi:outer membrane protein assembly factor BamD
MLKTRLIILYITVALVFTACSKHQKLLKSSDNDLKYETAVSYFNKGDYNRALQLLEQLVSVYRGTSRAEKVFYYYAYSYYELKDYMMASYYFKRFAESFPSSENAEECMYLAAYCTYMESPKYSLDQSSTYDAIKEFQAFINKYPQSDKVADCNFYIDEMRGKLEHKAYEIAELYLKMEDYQAAIVSFENLITDYPDTQYKELALYGILKSYYNYAENSIFNKRKERHQKALDSYNDFVALFPESDYRRQADKMNQSAQEILLNLN